MDRYTPHNYKPTSPYASTSQVTLEAMPRPAELPLARTQTRFVGTHQGSNPPFSPSPQSSQDLRYRQSHRHVPLPPTGEGHVELNPLLLARRESLIRYNMTSPPTTASAFGVNPGWMLEAATRPNLRSMTIISSELIPRPIIVHASTNPFIVTIGDVLVAVHGALHTLVTEYEYRLALPPNTAGWQVGNGYRNGMRWLDLLNGRFWWVGLSATQEGPEMWNLHLQR